MIDLIKNFVGCIKRFAEGWLEDSEKLVYYRQKMKDATTFNSWSKCAMIVDRLEGKEDWKLKKESSLYDYKEVENTLKQLTNKRERGDIHGLIHLLRGVLRKNVYSINTSYLYSHCHVGTKKLIEDFLAEVHLDLDYLVKLPEKKISLIKKLEFFSEAKHSYGRTALMLSGGAIFGLYHIGIIITLLENNLLPQVICGSSVGSVVASMLCCLNYDELYNFMNRKHEDFDGPFHLKNYKDNLLSKIYRLVFKGAVREIEVLRNYMQELLGNITFKEAYHKTGRILNINVTGYKEHDHNIILNYITAPNVLIFSAAAASSAAPVMFGPTELLCKNENDVIVPYSFSSKRKKYIDGSLSADVPMKRLGELFNVNTFIVSQVNPWVIPFLDDDDENKSFLKKKKINIWSILLGLILSEIRHRIKQLQKFLPHKYSQLLNLITQDYTGDITIFPEFSFRDMYHLVSNPTGLDYHRFKIFGNKRIFSKISMIESIMKTETLLEKYYSKLKSRLHKEVLQHKSYAYDEEIKIEKENKLIKLLEPIISMKGKDKLGGIGLYNESLLNHKLTNLSINLDSGKKANFELVSPVKRKDPDNILGISNDHTNLIFGKTSKKLKSNEAKLRLMKSSRYGNNLEITKEKLEGAVNGSVVNETFNSEDLSISIEAENEINNISTFSDFENISFMTNEEGCLKKQVFLKRLNNSELNLKLLEEIGYN